MPNKVYYAPETVKVFVGSGGDAVITLASLANAAGRISAQLDRGTGSLAAELRWQAKFKVAVAPAIGAGIRVYLITGQDSTTVLDGGFGTADAAVTPEDMLRNATLIGTVVCDEASNTKSFVRSGLIWVKARYLSIAVWNDSGQALSATSADCEIRLTPEPDEIQ